MPYNELKVGMIMIGDEDVSSCWKENGKIVPFRITEIKNGDVFRRTFTRENEKLSSYRNNGCNCTDVLAPRISLYEDFSSGDNKLNESITQKNMSILKNAFKSDKDKAFSYFAFVDTYGEYTRGFVKEWAEASYNGLTAKEFDEKIIKIWEEETKKK